MQWWEEDEITLQPGDDWRCGCRESAPDRIGTVAVLRPGRSISHCALCGRDAPWMAEAANSQSVSRP